MTDRTLRCAAVAVAVAAGVVLAGAGAAGATERNGGAVPDGARVLREGPGGLAVFLCPAHSEGLPAWPGVVTHADSGSMSCGVVLDFRSAEQLLQSHADLFS
ncbi:hypothetical protein [Streptomyces sp. NPDC059928]|uniref:hypothetical protein n=1 Tax=unclassified Streptomyces TaxID=2593676 RepID=UPI00365A0F6D